MKDLKRHIFLVQRFSARKALSFDCSTSYSRYILNNLSSALSINLISTALSIVVQKYIKVFFCKYQLKFTKYRKKVLRCFFSWSDFVKTLLRNIIAIAWILQLKPKSLVKRRNCYCLAQKNLVILSINISTLYISGTWSVCTYIQPTLNITSLCK